MGFRSGREISDDAGVRRTLMDCHRLAILGIKPASRASQPAFFVPEYLQKAGYVILPVPVYYPAAQTILGENVYRRLVDVPPPIDMVVVFRRPEDIPAHLPDVIEARPRYVWFQTGIRNDEAARTLEGAGIAVVQDRCTMADHRRLVG